MADERLIMNGCLPLNWQALVEMKFKERKIISALINFILKIFEHNKNNDMSLEFGESSQNKQIYNNHLWSGNRTLSGFQIPVMFYVNTLTH